ncbi:DJ-1/PfpI family protein [Kitasatospora sp. NPDC001547]|uniref:DJ-1/PfpI family protein n=1 Tax=Kitasatospora sp. NPDC001547 TaxID=3364015 RepID=UPI0036D02053|nr:DJ-1/PfpI family protein [Kitasatospora sp. Xyl93]
MDRRHLLRSGTAAAAGLGLIAATHRTAAASAPASAPGSPRVPAAATAPEPPAPDADGSKRPLRVHTVLYDGVEEQDFAGPVEAFGVLGHDGRIEQTFVTAEGPRTVRTAAGLEVTVRAPWSPRSADVIVVPGGGLGEDSALARQIRLGVLPRALAAARRPGLTLAGVCSGTLLLCAAGLTTGRPCTTHHAAKQELLARGGRVVDGRVVDDGDLVTCGGVTSGIDLAVWLVERHFGPQAAILVETVLEHERRGTVWRER